VLNVNINNFFSSNFSELKITAFFYGHQRTQFRKKQQNSWIQSTATEDGIKKSHQKNKCKTNQAIDQQGRSNGGDHRNAICIA
jgi:hypothetical protein